MAYQATKKTRKEKEHKFLLKEKDQEIVAREQSRCTLAEAMKSAIAEFPPEEGQEDEDSAAKVSWLSQIAVQLKK